MFNLRQKIIFSIWSNFIKLLYVFFRTFSWALGENFKTEVRLRKKNKKSLNVLKNFISTGEKKTILFFCSSAGEYDQAAPLIRQYQQKNYLPVICFFSTSGLSFARKRGEKNPVFLYPMDTKSNARYVLRIVSPKKVYIVRQEIWPSFIYEAAKLCPLYLINVSRGESSEKTIPRIIKQTLYPLFSKIFVVAEQDFNYLRSELNINPQKIVIAGDSKYDNVFERSQSKYSSVAQLLKELSKITGSKIAERTKVIIGSSWPEDVNIATQNISELIKKYDFQLIIAPHKISEIYLKSTEDILCQNGLQSVRFSERNTPNFLYEKNQIIILDTIGHLTEMYALTEIALVGGAYHYQVHNVLEPASHGVNLTFGPLYKNSHEAIDLVEKGHVTPVLTNQEFIRWLEQALNKPYRNKNLQAYVKSLSGATEKIMKSTNGA